MVAIPSVLRSPRKVIALLGGVGLIGVSVPVNWHYLFGDVDRNLATAASASSIIGGHLTAAVTDSYNRGFLFRESGIDLFGTLSWVLFQEGRKGVLSGKGGWLFSAEEYDSDAGSPARVEAAARFVSDVRDRLAADGVGLLVALVPAKVSIYPEEMVRYRIPDEPAGRYDRLLGLLGSEGVAVVDLRPPLRAAKPTGQLYLRTDTHWTPLGATVAANAIAAVVTADLGEPTRFARSDRPVEEHRGDLLRFVRLAGAARSLEPAPDRLTPFEAVPEGEEDGALFGDDAIPVALVGTSYSANAKWSFEAALKLALGHDVLNVAEEGKGPFQPMSAWLASDAYRDGKPKLVIWEIPERFADDAYPPEAFRIPPLQQAQAEAAP